MMIETCLIANRGEIACRIMRTCRRMGIRTVAVYSDADQNAHHVQLADTAVHIGPAPAPDSYLNIPAIIKAAQKTGADAVHPGFGFLAENADFARACAAAGLIFVGPSADAIEAMGNKSTAKKLVKAAGVPTIPGYNGDDQMDASLAAEAEKIGFPVMVKAAAGGGGKGMRLVPAAADLPAALVSARREALQAFGADALILEKALTRPRHIEFQIIGDRQGNLIHLGERECSIQRRQQKVIEETPSPILNADLRARMGQTAVRAAQTVNYTNAGTVEFLLDESGEFFFLEMNTRLQVEHPVTEMVTGIDIVEWQLRLAAGEPLPLTQAEVQLQGHAIEARVYAENPANDFLPETGPVLLWQAAQADGIRVDDGIRSGDEVSIHYDPMLAKVIAHGADRQTAVQRLRYALEKTTLLGLRHNITYLQAVLRHPDFEAGQLHTGFLADHFAEWQPPEVESVLALTAVTLIQFHNHPQHPSNSGYWRNNPTQPLRYLYQIGELEIEIGLTPQPYQPDRFMLSGPFAAATVELAQMDLPQVVFRLAGVRRQVTAVAHHNNWWVKTEDGIVQVRSLPLLPEAETAVAGGGSLRAPMPGSVLEVLVEVGQEVQAGQALMKLEAMKMEHTIRSSSTGIVEAIYYTAGDTVEADAQLLTIGSS